MQANDPKGLHYISDFVSIGFSALAGCGQRMRGGDWGGSSQPNFSNTSRCSGSGCV